MWCSQRVSHDVETSLTIDDHVDEITHVDEIFDVEEDLMTMENIVYSWSSPRGILLEASNGLHQINLTNWNPLELCSSVTSNPD
jgi:hypothetical protein